MDSGEQVRKLLDFILREVANEPSQSEGVADCAIRIIRGLQSRLGERPAQRDLCLANMLELSRMVMLENANQMKKWGVQYRSPFEWLAFATEELGELSKAMIQWRFERAWPAEVVDEAIQTATLCLKIAEMFTYEERLT